MDERSIFARGAMEGVMMRSVMLAPVFAMMLGTAAASAQYDFYDFMNSAGYVPGPSVSMNAPNMNSPTELVSLDDFEMIQEPAPAAQEFTQAQSPEELGPSVTVQDDRSEPATLGSDFPPLEFGYGAPQAPLGGPELLCPDGRWGHQGHVCGQRHGHTELMPYRQPILPPPASLYGYFNSPPCYAHLWDTYPQEAAARCARAHHATRPYQPRRGVRGELVEPCH
jgi:hypothetical protein